MSNGSRERERPQDVQCQHCGRFYRNDGIHGHEPHCPLKGEDVVIVPLEGATEGGDPLAKGAGTPESETPDVEATGGPTPGVVDDVQEDRDGARADGGRVMDPPSPAEPAGPDRDPDGADEEIDDVADHLVDADEYLTRAERKNPHLARTEEWRRIRAAAEAHEYVDLRQTDLEAGRVELV